MATLYGVGLMGSSPKSEDVAKDFLEDARENFDGPLDIEYVIDTLTDQNYTKSEVKEVLNHIRNLAPSFKVVVYENPNRYR